MLWNQLTCALLPGRGPPAAADRRRSLRPSARRCVPRMLSRIECERGVRAFQTVGLVEDRLDLWWVYTSGRLCGDALVSCLFGRLHRLSARSRHVCC
eukprot:2509041-Rhodomonas_salina.1